MNKLSLDKIIGAFAPHICISCGAEGNSLCDRCVALYHEPVQPRCAGCHKLSEDFAVCSACRNWLPLQKIYIGANYDGVSEQLVKSLKFEYQRTAVEPMSVIMAQLIEDVPNTYVLCPIPTAPSRIRERGFDHSRLIAKILSNKTSLVVINALSRRTNVRQLGSSRKARMEHMQQEFSLNTKTIVKDRDIVLVDDVVTTGATLAAASRVLKKAGARSVSAVVFAQKA